MSEADPREDWHDPRFARDWDATHDVGNPSRKEHLDLVTALLAAHCPDQSFMLDLGIGSAQLEATLLTKRPDLHAVGVDSSAAMLALARSRLDAIGIAADRCRLILADLQGPDPLSFPDLSFSAAVTIQTLHHMPAPVQEDVHRFVYQRLGPGGLYLVMDRLALADAQMDPHYAAMWQWLDKRASVPSAWPPEAFLSRFKQNGDFAVSPEAMLSGLTHAGFRATCLALSLNRGLFAAVKPPEGTEKGPAADM